MAVSISSEELGKLIWRVDALPHDAAENVIGDYRVRGRRIGPRIAYSGPNQSAFALELALVLVERIMTTGTRGGHVWVPDEVIDELRLAFQTVGPPDIAVNGGIVYYWPSVYVR